MTKPDRSLYTLDEERVLPWGDPGHFAWHLARYRFAVPFVGGKRVLDVGSGEGYGAALLAEGARDVLGIDYSPPAIRHARVTYKRQNLRFEIVDADALDLGPDRFDVVTCFEVIEHLEDGEALLSRVAALLRPDGTLLLSTPNRLVEGLFERVGGRDHYEYHVNAISPSELRRRARRHFGSVTLLGQSVRGNALHAMLKGLDVLNLRHRLLRSLRLQHAISASVMGTAPAHVETSFRFSRLLVRQSPHVMLVGRRPIAAGPDSAPIA